MAFPWLVVLQSVPWTDVIKNAPKVAEGAKKLWSTVSKTGLVAKATAESSATPHSSEPQAIAAMQARLTAMEATIADLHSQMLASSELIKTLAEQNARLIERVEANRNRQLWLALATIVVGIIAVVALVGAPAALP